MIIDYLVNIKDPRKDKIIKYHNKHIHLIEKAKGSSHNHQAWEGGYKDHILQCFELVEKLYLMLNETCVLPFTKDSAMIVMYFHDIEKIFKYVLGQDINKATYYNNILAEEGIIFSDQEINALKYIHGEGEDYSSKKRTMNELAAFCHAVDTISARILYDQTFVPSI